MSSFCQPIRKTVIGRWCCEHCGGDHPSDRHRWSEDIETNGVYHAPLETPSHNGAYQGTVEVVTIAPGVSGLDLRAWKRRGRTKRGPTEWGRPWE